MHFQFDGYNYLVRLDKGEELISRLEQLAAEQDIAGGWISGVGAALSVELGFYQMDKKVYSYRKLDRLMEVVSLGGPLAWHDDSPAIHLHGVVSDEQAQTYGGHVKKLIVGGTCELFIHVWNKLQLQRTPSEEVGLNLLDL